MVAERALARRSLLKIGAGAGALTVTGLASGAPARGGRRGRQHRRHLAVPAGRAQQLSTT